MKHLAYLLTLLQLLSATQTWAGLPPTTTKFNGDSNPATTFEFDFPNISVTHSGTKATANTVNATGGGTGLSNPTTNSILVTAGSSNMGLVTAGTNGNVLTDNGTTWVSSAAPGNQSASNNVLNAGLSASVATNALTVALKQSDGSTDPTVGSPTYIGFRSSTATTGGYSQRSVTSSLSVVIPSGTTIGTKNGLSSEIFVYAIDNAGTVELAVSLSPGFDNGTVQNTTAISGGATSTVLYSTTARTGVAVRLLGRVTASESTAGTWASSPTEVSVNPFMAPPSVYANYYVSAATQTPGAGNQINFDTKVTDSFNAVTTGAGWKFTVPIPGEYQISTFLNLNGTGGVVRLEKNGSVYASLVQLSTNISIQGETTLIDAVTGDTFDLRTVAASVLNGGSAPILSSISIVRVGN